MEALEFNNLLLKTAFSCMACDGDIDKREVKLIKRLHKENKTFGALDINVELDNLLNAIKVNGFQFLKDYFNELRAAQLSETEEMKLVEIAIETIKADEKIEYSEIKFFKVIRSELAITNKTILSKHSDFEEYLEEDIISDSYLAKYQEDLFGSQSFSQFELINEIDDDYVLESFNEEE